mgnify:CR=1 FL=1
MNRSAERLLGLRLGDEAELGVFEEVHRILALRRLRQPMGRPQPRPPVAARPRQLWVTQVEAWMRNPYADYARHVLGLRRLDDLDACRDPTEGPPRSPNRRIPRRPSPRKKPPKTNGMKYRIILMILLIGAYHGH